MYELLVYSTKTSACATMSRPPLIEVSLEPHEKETPTPAEDPKP